MGEESMAIRVDTIEATDLRWRQHAACRSSSPDLFFPVGTVGPALGEIEAAKAVCARCAVQGPCLEFALVTNQEFGVWGGTSEEERRRLRQGRRAQGDLPVRSSV
jgi:WhiB family redox-sensing transcriptional regulator